MTTPPISSQNNLDLKGPLIAAGFQVGQYEFASGETANNKLGLDAETLETSDPELYHEVVGRLAVQARQFKPNALTYVPNGARGYAHAIGHLTGLPVVEMVATPNEQGGKDVALARGFKNLARFVLARRIVLIEDVTTELTSVNRTLEMPFMKHKVAGIAAIWRRGVEGREKPLPKGIRASWLVEAPMPRLMTPGLIDHHLRHKTRFQNQRVHK